MNNICIYQGCKNISEYNYEDEDNNKYLYCFIHKLDNMVNIKCKNDWCNKLIKINNNEYCSWCFIHSFYIL
jgi:hypothetical protein